MPEDPRPIQNQDQTIASEPPGAAESGQPEEEIGDFINRHVFERGPVFFEG